LQNPSQINGDNVSKHVKPVEVSRAKKEGDIIKSDYCAYTLLIILYSFPCRTFYTSVLKYVVA